MPGTEKQNTRAQKTHHSQHNIEGGKQSQMPDTTQLQDLL